MSAPSKNAGGRVVEFGAVLDAELGAVLLPAGADAVSDVLGITAPLVVGAPASSTGAAVVCAALPDTGVLGAGVRVGLGVGDTADGDSVVAVCCGEAVADTD